jgi:hypothetical protein
VTWDPARDTPPPTAEALARRDATVAVQKRVRQRAFLDAYAETATVRSAADCSGVHYRTAQGWRQDSEQDEARHMVDWPAGSEPRPFHECLAEARQMACDLIEEEIQRRAFGYDRELVYQGRKTGQTIREHSDLILIFKAKRMIPEYRDNHTVQVNHGGRVEIDSARDRLKEKLLAAIERQQAALNAADPAATALPIIDVEPVRVLEGGNDAEDV